VKIRADLEKGKVQSRVAHEDGWLASSQVRQKMNGGKEGGRVRQYSVWFCVCVCVCV
jgi:hypothetical protein